MRIYRFSRETRGLLFDMDMTLYSNLDYLQSQIDLPIQRLAEREGLEFEEMKEIFSARGKALREQAGGKQVTLGSAFAAFGVSLEETIIWREELYQPERYLTRDERLQEALASLASRYAFALLTNNPVSIAKRTLAALGVGEFFPVILGLDTFGVSKPHETPIREAAAALVPELTPPASFKVCASIGDRYDVDLALPLKLGMGGILVDGVEDVYALPETLGAYLLKPAEELQGAPEETNSDFDLDRKDR